MNERPLANLDCIILTAVYNDWPSVSHLIPVLDQQLVRLGMTGRVVIVDDASTDEEGDQQIKELTLSAIRSVDVVRLASNLGNQRALAIGIAYVAKNLTCDYLVVMDSDFEDKPDTVPDLLMACHEGKASRIVFAERAKRSEGAVFKTMYFLYKCLNRLLTGSTISVGNFSAIPGRFIRRLAHIAELWNHFPASIIRAGIPHGRIPNERGVRLHGKGKMNFVKLILHAFSSFAIYADVVAIRMMILALIVGLGFFFVIIGGIVIYLNTDLLIPGWTSQFFLGSLILFSIVLGTATIVLFTFLSLRIQSPMIPYHDHVRFIFEVVRLYAAANEARPAELRHAVHP